MDQIPKAETGYATSLYSVVRNMGSSVGVSFVTTFVARRSQFHQSILAAHLTPDSLPVRQFLGQASRLFVAGGSDRSAASVRSIAALYGMLQQQAALLSFVEAFRIMGILFLCIVPLVVLMRRARQKGTSPALDRGNRNAGQHGNAEPA